MTRLTSPPKLKFDKMSELFSRMSVPAVEEYVARANADYLHWEKLRYLPAPAGLAAEDAWTVVKFSRLGPRKNLPLLDESGRPFTYWLPTPSQQVLHEVDRWGGTTLAVEEGIGQALGSMRERVLISSLMEEAIATSQIEGAATTRQVAKEMLRTNRKPRDRSEQMILNSYRTIQMLRQRLDRPLSLGLLFEIQESMTRDTLDNPSAVGRLRTAEENVCVVDVRDNEVIFTPPRADHLPLRLERLIEFANRPCEGDGFIHPLVKASILHFWLAYEHPFVDGNGRTARALFYWFMLKSGYWLFEFLTISRIIVNAPAQYYRSFLHTENDDNDLTYAILYLFRATKEALLELRRYLVRKQEEQQATAAALRAFPDLNHRQRAFLEDALRHPERVHTFRSHRETYGVTNVTARSDLLDLLERGLLAETRVGKQRGFLAVPDLPDRLTPKQRRAKKS